MKIKFIVPLSLLMLTGVAKGGNMIMQFSANAKPQTIYITRAMMSDLMQNGRPEILTDTIAVTGNTLSYDFNISEPARFDIYLDPESKAIPFYAAPEDRLIVSVESSEPLNYTVGGTQLMDGITTLEQQLRPLEIRYREAAQAENRDTEAIMNIMDEYNRTAADFIRQNPSSTAAPFALLNYDGNEFMELYDLMTPEARTSILFPAAALRKAQVEEEMAKEERQHELTSGNMMAPDFSLKGLDGKEISLSELRGKWVIIDFWGSWCPWCIKGFPALKEAYAKYSDKLEVLGVDCGDTEEAWRDAVKKYSLPWLNVYNPGKSGTVLEQYAVQGFPTKVLVNPEGKIADLVVGEDPSFFTRLASLLGESK